MAKTGIVFIDVGWHNRLNEHDGLPLEAEVRACWNVEDDANPLNTFVDAEFENVDDAVAWARERAPLVLVRPTDRENYSAGEERAIDDLAEDDEPPHLVPVPEWPPPGWTGS